MQRNHHILHFSTLLLKLTMTKRFCRDHNHVLEGPGKSWLPFKGLCPRRPKVMCESWS